MRALARRERFLGSLLAVTAPTLLLMGRHDRLVPLQAAEAVARLRPDWGFVVFDDLGHVPHLEGPQEWLRAVGSWLSERLGPVYATLRPAHPYIR